MALQTIHPFVFPKYSLNASHFQTLSNFADVTSVMTVLGDKVAFIFRVPKDGTLAKVGFLTGPIVASTDLKVSFQDVDPTTTGDPDGGADQFRVVTAPNAWTWIETGLMTDTGADGGAKRTVTEGQMLAIVIEFSTAASTSTAIVCQLCAGQRALLGNQYVDRAITGGGYAKQNGLMPHFALEYDDGSYAPLPEIIPMTSNAGHTAASITTQDFPTGLNSTPDEVGIQFQLPYLCKIGGFFVHADLDGPTDFVLYDNQNVPKITVSVNPIIRERNGQNPYWVPGPDVVYTLNSIWRAVVKPTDTTAASTAVGYFDVAKAAIWDQMDGGQTCFWTERTNGADSWTSRPLRRPFIGVLITALEDGIPAAGGGGVVVPVQGMDSIQIQRKVIVY